MYNKTTLFCLAMIEPDFLQSSYRMNFSNAFLDITDKPLDYQIALLYSSYPDNTAGCHEVISLPEGQYLIIYPIKEEYRSDFDYFKQGLYSMFCDELKKKIGAYFGWNSKCYYATIKHKSLKAELENRINANLSNDAELYDIVDENEETFNLTTNDNRNSI